MYENNVIVLYIGACSLKLNCYINVAKWGKYLIYNVQRVWPSKPHLCTESCQIRWRFINIEHVLWPFSVSWLTVFIPQYVFTICKHFPVREERLPKRPSCLQKGSWQLSLVHTWQVTYVTAVWVICNHLCSYPTLVLSKSYCQTNLWPSIWCSTDMLDFYCLYTPSDSSCSAMWPMF